MPDSKLLPSDASTCLDSRSSLSDMSVYGTTRVCPRKSPICQTAVMSRIRAALVAQQMRYIICVQVYRQQIILSILAPFCCTSSPHQTLRRLAIPRRWWRGRTAAGCHIKPASVVLDGGCASGAGRFIAIADKKAFILMHPLFRDGNCRLWPILRLTHSHCTSAPHCTYKNLTGRPRNYLDTLRHAGEVQNILDLLLV